MLRPTRPYPPGSAFASVPLAVAYAGLPLGVGLLNATGAEAGFPPTLPWLLVAGAGLAATLCRSQPGEPPRRGAVFRLCLLGLFAVGLVLYKADLAALAVGAQPHLAETIPAVMLLVAGLWARCCGLPDHGDFQRYGALLGLICIVDLAVEATVFSAAPAVRWIGNSDVLAGLLLLSLCAGLGDEGGETDAPDVGPPMWRWLVMAGLLACLSRTGLFAAAWVVLSFGQGSKLGRATYAATCFALMVGTFFLPATLSDAVRYADYWLWMESVQLLRESPMLLLTGLPLDAPLPMEFPVGLHAVWELATGGSPMDGARIQQIPSFWLRATMAWGILAPLGCLAAVGVFILRRPTPMSAGLSAALFAQGLTTPLLYDPATAMCVGLVFCLALSEQARPRNVRITDAQRHLPEPEPLKPL